MQLKINHLQHIGIPVAKMEVSQHFYEGLGFKNIMGASFDFNNDKGKVVMMQLDDIIIELYQFPAPELTAIQNRKDGHVDHIAFDVDDIDDTFSELKKANYKIIEEAPVFLNFWKNGCKYFNIIGPGGERLEFNQIL